MPEKEINGLDTDERETLSRGVGNQRSALLKTILLTGLLVGTLDGAAAVASFLLHTGGNPTRIFVYIASGVFGRDAFTAGNSMLWWGLVFHYFIATSWTALFFLMHQRYEFLSKSRVWNGIGYGFAIWLVMNLVVLPLSNVPALRRDPARVVEGVVILIVMVGLPVSFISSKYYRRTNVKNRQ